MLPRPSNCGRYSIHDGFLRKLSGLLGFSTGPKNAELRLDLLDLARPELERD